MAKKWLWSVIGSHKDTRGESIQNHRHGDSERLVFRRSPTRRVEATEGHKGEDGIMEDHEHGFTL